MKMGLLGRQSTEWSRQNFKRCDWNLSETLPSGTRKAPLAPSITKEERSLICGAATAATRLANFGTRILSHSSSPLLKEWPQRQWSLHTAGDSLSWTRLSLNTGPSLLCLANETLPSANCSLTKRDSSQSMRRWTPKRSAIATGWLKSPPGKGRLGSQVLNTVTIPSRWDGIRAS